MGWAAGRGRKSGDTAYGSSSGILLCACECIHSEERCHLWSYNINVNSQLTDLNSIVSRWDTESCPCAGFMTWLAPESRFNVIYKTHLWYNSASRHWNSVRLKIFAACSYKSNRSKQSIHGKSHNVCVVLIITSEPDVAGLRDIDLRVWWSLGTNFGIYCWFIKHSTRR